MSDLFITTRDWARLALQRQGETVTALWLDMIDDPDWSGWTGMGTVLRSMGRGAFVTLPFGQGWLPEAEGLAEGSRLPVQVLGEPEEEQKHWRLTSRPQYTGRLLICRPRGEGVEIASRLDAPTADRLEASIGDALLALGGGWMVRSAAASVPPAVILEEAERLLAAASTTAEPTSLAVFLHRVLSAAGAVRIHAGNAALAAAIQDWQQHHHPHAPPPVTLMDDQAIDWDSLLNALAAQRVALSPAGDLRIEQTCVATTIDINAGAARDLMAVNTVGLRAAAHQIRLRNLGGRILIDPVAGNRHDRPALVEMIEEAVADDPVAMTVHGFTRGGLLELVRPRRSRSHAAFLARWQAQA